MSEASLLEATADVFGTCTAIAGFFVVLAVSMRSSGRISGRLV